MISKTSLTFQTHFHVTVPAYDAHSPKNTLGGHDKHTGVVLRARHMQGAAVITFHPIIHKRVALVSCQQQINGHTITITLYSRIQFDIFFYFFLPLSARRLFLLFYLFTFLPLSARRLFLPFYFFTFLPLKAFIRSYEDTSLS